MAKGGWHLVESKGRRLEQVEVEFNRGEAEDLAGHAVYHGGGEDMVRLTAFENRFRRREGRRGSWGAKDVWGSLDTHEMDKMRRRQEKGGRKTA